MELRRTAIAVLLAAGLGAAGCAGVDVLSAPGGVDVGSLESWRWAPLPPTLIGDAEPRDARVLDVRLRRVVEHELGTKGYRLTDGRPDFFIHYAVSLSGPLVLDRIYLNDPVYVTWGRWTQTPYAFAGVDALPPGGLVIDALDAGGVLLWRGALPSGVAAASTAEQREALAREAAEAILAQFPIRAK